jgi:DNA-binding NtrC family response regulator
MMGGKAPEYAPNADVTVVLLETDEVLRSVIARGLLLREFQVIQAETVEDVMRIWRRNAKQILVADVISLEERAVDIIQAIKAVDPETKVLLLSGHDQKTIASLHKGLMVGNELLEKPFTADLLAAVIQRLAVTRGFVKQNKMLSCSREQKGNERDERGC